jgi:hypothetical protein
MTLKEKFFHSFFLGILFSVLNWLIIDNFIISLSIYEYILIELTLVVSMKLFKFTKQKLNLN